MFNNYLKIALRNFSRHKASSFINICGLAIGMACCTLIFLFIQDELSYDTFHSESENIYRLVAENRSGGETRHIAPIGAPYAEMFSGFLPEIRNTVRIYPGNRILVRYDEKRFFEERFFHADPSIFEVFSFPLIRGDRNTVLSAPYSVVISEAMAAKYFGNEDPVGGRLILANDWEYTVTGVMRDIPDRTHFRCDFIASLETLSDIHGERFLKHPGYLSFYTYLLLEEGTDPDEFEAKILAGAKEYFGERLAAMRRFYLQPLESIHLHSRLEYELEVGGSLSYLYVYSVIALFILMIASFNFMNLSTARSASRAKEVGIRKVVGAFRIQLIKQFLGESLLVSLFSLLIAVLIAGASLRFFNTLTGKALGLDHFLDSGIFLGFIGIIFAVGLLAGLYPALFLAAFQPIRTLRGKLGAGGRSGSLRRILVVSQFAVSVILISGTFIIQNQLRYMRNRDLGFKKEQVVVIPLHDVRTRDIAPAFKQELLQNSSILAVTASSSVPGRSVTNIAYYVEGGADDEHESLDTFFVDFDFVETLGIDVIAGRNFSREYATDPEKAFILNETAARMLGWSDPLGKEILWPSDLRRRDAIVKSGRVIGIVRDFNIASLHESIGPVIMQISPKNFRYLSVRVATANLSETLVFLGKIWNEKSPAFPFEFSFLDEDFNRLYRSDQKVGRIIGIFSLLAIFIACLGLFGLGSYSAEQRTKEIGVRKVLGATFGGVLLLMSKEFSRWVLAANAVGLPIAYLVMNRWLQNFAFRVPIAPWTFIWAALMTLGIAGLTVSYQSVKAALTDPVESLRYE